MMFNYYDEGINVPSDLKGVSGIYMLRNCINGKCYVGQTNDLHRRRREYFNNTDRREGRSIYAAIREYGSDNFEFKVLKCCPVKDLDRWERYYAERYDVISNGYNERPWYSAGNRNPSLKIRKKMSKSHVGLVETSSTKRKKSKPIYAIDEEENILYVCDSGKLFASFTGDFGKDLVNHAITGPSRLKKYRLYYADKALRDPIVQKQIAKGNRCRDKEYIEIAKFLDSYCVETIADNNRYKVVFMTYENTIQLDIKYAPYLTNKTKY